MKNLLFIVLALFATLAFAQKERTISLNKETNLIDVVYYHDNGAISQTGSYSADGKLEGVWLSYNKEGAVIVKAVYKNGEKTGKWAYLVNGILKEVDYSNSLSSL